MAKPRDENLVIKLWHQLTTNNLFIQVLFKFMRFVELAIVQAIGSLEDKRAFFNNFYGVQVAKSIGKAFGYCHSHVCSRFLH
jgi:hypothetical protein